MVYWQFLQSSLSITTQITHQLRFHQISERPIFGAQLLKLSGLYYAAISHYGNASCMTNGAQSMSNRDDCFAAVLGKNFLEGGLHKVLALSIQGACRLFYKEMKIKTSKKL